MCNECKHIIIGSFTAESSGTDYVWPLDAEKGLPTGTPVPLAFLKKICYNSKLCDF